MSRVPETLAPFFPDYEFKRLNPKADAELIMERTLEYGNFLELRWLFTCYGEDRVRDFVRKHGYRSLSRRAFHYWRLILDVAEPECPPWAETAAELWGR